MNAPAGSIELYQQIPVGVLYASPTNPRKTFDKKALEELADSLRNEGILAPLLVRPDKRHAGGYEVIAGERRMRAAKLAGLAALPCVVRDLTDAQVELHQAIEWVQRADLHPLEEAEAYEGLAKRHRMSPEDIAAKVSKSESYIRGRMKLCALSAKAREWFLKGSLTPTTALLVARIPVPSLQDEAVEHLVARDGNPMHATDAAHVIRERYMTRLDGASFDTGDATLVPAAGACGPCPKRTGNQAGLFGDVKDADTSKGKAMASETGSIERASREGNEKAGRAKRVYISGPMTGHKDLNFAAFNAEAARLRGLGYEVINPAEINPEPAKTWHECLRADVRALVDCDIVALLPGWERSEGAQLEQHLAHRLGLEVRRAETLQGPAGAAAVVRRVEGGPVAPLTSRDAELAVALAGLLELAELLAFNACDRVDCSRDQRLARAKAVLAERAHNA